jgi:hypothetical protein
MVNAPVRRLRRAQASQYLLEHFGVSRSPATLAKLACIGGGPVFVKVNNTPLYDPRDLDAWVASRTSAPLASTSAAA